MIDRRELFAQLAGVELDDWCGEWQIRGPWVDKETGISVERVLAGMADVAAGRTVSMEDLERECPAASPAPTAGAHCRRPLPAPTAGGDFRQRLQRDPV